MEQFYPDAEELLPPNMPKLRGRYVNIITYVDAYLAGNLETWGIIQAY